MYNKIGKGAVRDAATARAGLSVDVGRPRDTGEGVIGIPMRHIDPIATKAGVPTAKDRRGCLVFGVLEPVPVWQIAVIAAFIAQGLLVCPDKLSMPGQEDPRAVDKVGLIDVTVREVICSRGSTWGEALVHHSRQFVQAFDSLDVL
jgi:hypothetical protein